MSHKKLLVSVLSMLFLVILFAVAGAFAASNTVPLTHLGENSSSISANDLAPSECGGINLANVIVISGSGNGTNGNDLILGSSGNDTIQGRGGDDCIITGGGDDWIHGGNGSDVCNGGTGSDTAIRCETELDIP